MQQFHGYLPFLTTILNFCSCAVWRNLPWRSALSNTARWFSTIVIAYCLLLPWQILLCYNFAKDSYSNRSTLQLISVYVEQFLISLTLNLSQESPCEWPFFNAVIILCIDSSLMKCCLTRKNLGCQQVLSPTLVHPNAHTCKCVCVCVLTVLLQLSMLVAGCQDRLEWTPILFQV